MQPGFVPAVLYAIPFSNADNREIDMKRLIAVSSIAALCLSLAGPLQADNGKVSGAASSSAAGSSAVVGGTTLLIILALGVVAVVASANSN
jgi:hypothetical protein